MWPTTAEEYDKLNAWRTDTNPEPDYVEYQAVLHLADILCPSCGKKMLHATDHIRCCSDGCELRGKKFKLPSVVLEEM